MPKRWENREFVLLGCTICLSGLFWNIWGNLFYGTVKLWFEKYTGVMEAQVLTGLATVIVPGLLAVGIVWGLARYLSREQMAPSKVQRTNGPSIAAELHPQMPMEIDGLHVVCAIRVENTTGQYLDERCLVKLLEMSGYWPPSMPRDFVLRTESQILGRRSGRFNMAIGDKKTVPILFQAHPRKDFLILIDENIDSRPVATREKSKHSIPFPARRPSLDLLIETSGAASPGRYLLSLTRGENWTLIPSLQQVATDYTLPQVVANELQQKSVAASRLPLLEFLDLAEREYGWRVRAQTGYDLLDLLYGLRQAGADRTVIFWGKTNRNRVESLVRDEPLGVINKAHWVEYQLEVFEALEEHRNFCVRTVNKQLRDNIAEGGFSDVQVDIETGTKWVREIAHKYRGHTRP